MAIILLTVQGLLLAAFCFVSVFNYLYGLASLFKPAINRVPFRSSRVAVVIVSFNEKHVLDSTLKSCDQLSYPDKLLVLADDSTDQAIVAKQRAYAISRGCTRMDSRDIGLDPQGAATGGQSSADVEIWQSDDFIWIHRAVNTGFKAGSMKVVEKLLGQQKIQYLYLLDADWQPQQDAIEQTLSVIQAQPDIAFVQTKRVSFPKGMNRFQRYVTIIEEGCYFVDFNGRQVLGHPILFSGCCTLFRLDYLEKVGGFTPGHLTEDLDLSNRIWLAGYKGVYLDTVVNYGEVPFTYEHFRKQQERWVAGTARSLKDYLGKILISRNLGLFDKLSVIRQNAYYSMALFTALTIVVSFIAISWVANCWNTYEVEYYLYLLDKVRTPFIILIYFCVLSNFVEPLILVLFKKRSYLDLFHLPMMVWYAWSLLLTFFIGNIKGVFNLEKKWYRTPKYTRDLKYKVAPTPAGIRTLNAIICCVFLLFYFVEGWLFGWYDNFSMLILPAFILASLKALQVKN